MVCVVTEQVVASCPIFMVASLLLTLNHGARFTVIGMDVTLLYFDDCPNWLVTSAHLDVLAAENPGMSITRHVVDTPEEAERTRFRGSPSVLVDGVDPFAESNDPCPALRQAACKVCHFRRIAGRDE